ncbi:MAG TPA: protein translocase subunit SecF [Candidatus Paceibacterota bacterium]|nr:protein translocase subunit SecF [Candidatus Pacearchaeota archaeon]HRZ50654.1 protein translocase subunit SecF [Candidatus Paceibacterota bacterium]HSA36449.1 protein translocase subunit SecF [Candidatus Paceibacterota bacterium]
MINFIKHKNIFLAFTAIVIAGCLGLLAVYGLKPSIEFTGGSITEIEYKDARPASGAIMEKIGGLGIKDITIYSVEDKGVSIRTEAIDNSVHTKLLEALRGTGEYTEKSFDMIGPVIGRELTSKMTLLVVVSLLAMLIYIAVAFRNVPGPVSPWIYGAASFLILVHDVLVPLGFFAYLGKNYGIQITIPIITALLTVVGYAINNVIVVYDRIRENLVKDRKSNFDEIANRAVNQTLTRQINTSIATLIPVFAIYFYGGLSLKYFALALILGIATGTYSSVFLASQSLVIWLNFKKKSVKKA